MATQVQESTSRWRDWAMLILAIWLILSPWILGFTTTEPVVDGPPTGIAIAAWNAWIVGAFIAAISAWAIYAFAQWQDWLNGILGVWLVVSPWILGFMGATGVVWNHAVVGLLVVLLTAWKLSVMRHPGTKAAA